MAFLVVLGPHPGRRPVPRNLPWAALFSPCRPELLLSCYQFVLASAHINGVLGPSGAATSANSILSAAWCSSAVPSSSGLPGVGLSGYVWRAFSRLRRPGVLTQLVGRPPDLPSLREPRPTFGGAPPALALLVGLVIDLLFPGAPPRADWSSPRRPIAACCSTACSAWPPPGSGRPPPPVRLR